MTDFTPGRGDPDELPEDYAEQWESVIASGILQDAAEVYEKGYREGGSDALGHGMNVARNPYRAQQVREGNA